MKTKELISLLQRAGFELIRANKHYIYSNGATTVTVPRHKEVNRFLAKQIIRQANLNAAA